MAFTFDPVVTSPTFNAYCTVQFARDYQDSKLNTSFASLTDAQVQRLIVWASRNLDTLEFKGVQTSLDQPMQFPRAYLWKDGGQYSTTEAVFVSSMFDSTTIPLFVQQSVADLCGVFAEEDPTEELGLAGLKRLKVDTIEIEADIKSSTAWFPSSARSLCYRYLKNTNAYSVRTERVG